MKKKQIIEIINDELLKLDEKELRMFFSLIFNYNNKL